MKEECANNIERGKLKEQRKNAQKAFWMKEYSGLIWNRELVIGGSLQIGNRESALRKNLQIGNRKLAIGKRRSKLKRKIKGLNRNQESEGYKRYAWEVAWFIKARQKSEIGNWISEGLTRRTGNQSSGLRMENKSESGFERGKRPIQSFMIQWLSCIVKSSEAEINDWWELEKVGEVPD